MKIKSRRMGWTKHVTRMGKKWGMRRKFWFKGLKERSYMGYLGVNGRILLKWILEK
jgi:hypothetical protein